MSFSPRLSFFRFPSGARNERSRRPVPGRPSHWSRLRFEIGVGSSIGHALRPSSTSVVRPPSGRMSRIRLPHSPRNSSLCSPASGDTSTTVLKSRSSRRSFVSLASVRHPRPGCCEERASQAGRGRRAVTGPRCSSPRDRDETATCRPRFHRAARSRPRPRGARSAPTAARASQDPSTPPGRSEPPPQDGNRRTERRDAPPPVRRPRREQRRTQKRRASRDPRDGRHGASVRDGLSRSTKGRGGRNRLSFGFLPPGVKEASLLCDTQRRL